MAEQATPKCHIEIPSRIELRSSDGPLLGVLVLDPLRLEVKKGKRIFEVDLTATIVAGQAIVSEVGSLFDEGHN